MLKRLLLLSLLLASPVLALEPYLVKDVNPVPEPASSEPESLVRLGNAALFFADDGLSGRELWRSDGTAAGTWPLTDLCDDPGCPFAVGPYLATERLYFFLVASGDPHDTSTLWVSDGTPGGTFRLTEPGLRFQGAGIWAASHGALYFAAQDEEHGAELWRSDGTLAGTRLVADVRPGSAGADVRWLTEYKGRVWFGADDGAHGGCLWRTDGTAAGTVLAIDPLPASAAHPAPYILGVLGSRLAFFAVTPKKGQQLWAGDGTPERTAPLATSPSPVLLYHSVVHGNRLYFVAEEKKGQELWVSDGTAKGTRAVTAFKKPDPFFAREGPFYSLYLPILGNLKNLFVFLANDGAHGAEPWVTDGTAKGTRLLRDVCPGPCGGAQLTWSELNGRLFFTALEGTTGFELWSTDGTAAGTRILRDLCPGSCGSRPFAPHLVSGRLFFVAGDGQTGQEIWSTDGTAAGTVRVSDFEPENVWNGFRGAVANGRLFFAADVDPYGEEVWSTDGTTAGTQLVRDLNQADLGGSSPHWLHALGDKAVFVASDASGPRLWKSDGTGPGTVQVRAFAPGEVDGLHPQDETAEAGGRLFFFLRQGGELVPWRTDGTEAGTFSLTDARITIPTEIAAVGDRAFFALRQEETGNEVWVSDGTAAGTRQVRDIVPGFGGSDPSGLTAFQGKLWFAAGTEATQRELWTSDGTEAGTVQVKEIHPLHGSGPNRLTVHGGRLWFFANDGEHGNELWKSDGTAAGTVLAAELAPGPESFNVDRMVSLGDQLLVSGYWSAERELGLWATDGTPDGTVKIGDHPPLFGAVFQGRLYYAVRDSISPVLWVTDGTAAGTGPFLDRDGHEIRDPGRFAVLSDHFVFNLQTLGVPLWISDGTSAGTFPLLARTLPGSTDPSTLVRAGDRVFFPNHDPSTGLELWAVEVP